ncbi:MAG: LysE family transporter [Pseudomonadota bacterium]
MSFETLALFTLVATIPAISPGPGVLFSITNALRYGALTTIILGIVNAAGIFVLCLAVGAGLSALLATSALAFTILKFVGAAYLVILGIRLWRDRSAFLVIEAPARPPLKTLTGQALAIALTNPKATVLLAALFPPFLSAEAPLWPQVLTLSAIYAALCVLNHTAIAFAGSALRRFLTKPARAAAVRRATGALFIGFGALLAGTTR